MVDVGSADIGEAAGADRVEGEVDHPFAGLRAGAGTGVGQVGAVDVDAPADGDLLGGAILHRQVVIARRRLAGGGRIGALIHQAERHVGGLADQLLDAVGVADAGKLHDDAALALAGDLRIDDAGLVDAAADDLDRLLDCAAGPGGQRGRRQRQDDGAIGAAVHCHVGRAGRRIGAGQRAHQGNRRLGLGRVAQPQQDAVLIRLGVKRLIEDLSAAQRLPHAVGQAV